MTRVFGFSDCGLCNGTGLVENLATGRHESCWRCADRAARTTEADDQPTPVRPAASAATGPTTPASPSPNSSQWSPERAATFLRVGLWLILGAGGVALVHFTGSNAHDRARDVSDQLEAPEQDSPETGGPPEYSKWEPVQ
jgi:hypothetical protein